MKKRMLSVFAGLVLLISSVALSGCKGNTPPAKVKIAAKQVYAVSAVSSMEYLKNTTAVPGPSASAQVGAEEKALARPTAIAGDMESVNTYVNMFKGYMTKEGQLYSSAKPTVDDGADYKDYKIKLSVTLPTAVAGVNENFIMYYNEVLQGTTTEVEENVEEVETSSTLTGVLVLNGKKSASITGERVVSTEGGETEAEITFTTVSVENPTNKIVVKQSIELNEVEFEYSIYENNVLTSNTSIDFENENNEEELELQFKSTANGTKSNVIYKFEKKLEGAVVVFNAEYIVDSVIHTFKIVPGDVNNHYVYDNKFEEDIKN